MKALLLGACMLAAAPALAQPELGKPQPAGPVTVYPDARRAGVFYYLPGGMAIAEAANGRPDLSFVHARYTGSAAMGDRGRTFFRSVLTFRVRLSGPAPGELQEARTVLGGPARAAAIELRPLPLRRMEAALVFAPLDAPAGAGGKGVAAPGHFEPADPPQAAAPASGEGAWRERTYTVGMDPATAQLFADALDRGRVALSLSYALYAGAGADPELVGNGALAIAVDTTRWPDLVRRIDINDRVPPGYAALDVYCYDFNNALRPDLYETQVEIEAEAVGGRPVRRLIAFQRDQQDLYARTLAFSVAVRLDRPYRYRVIEVNPDGVANTGAWQAGRAWTEILDVTNRTAATAGAARRPR